MKQQQNMYRRSRSSWFSLSICKILFMIKLLFFLTCPSRSAIINAKLLFGLIVWLSRALVGVAGELFFLRSD